MANFIDRRSVSSIAVGFVFGLVVSGAANALGDRTSSNETSEIRGKYRHPMRIPDPTVASGCLQAAATYASALQKLEDAESAADDAYDAWYDCEMGEDNRPMTVKQPLGPEYSVLLDEQSR